MTNKDKETRKIEQVGLYAFIVNLALAGLKANTRE
jgi:hypothetical protein